MIIDGYVRVSQVAGRSGPSFISPAVQREQIEGWAKLHGALVGEVFEELDESGGRSDRPLLERAIRRVEAGESQGLVVAKLDRFGRSLVDGLAAIERVEAAGGAFASVQDGLDLGTDTGRLVLRIMLSMAEWELDRVRTGWRIARSRAVARGVWIAPIIPVGYTRRPDGRLETDPRTAPVIAELFARRARDESITSLCRWLESHSVRTSQGNPGWTQSTLRQVLALRAYLGEVHCAGQVKRDAHPALVSRPTWHRAQRTRSLQGGSGSRTTAPLLTGLLRCAGCRMILNAAMHRRGPNYVSDYRCRGHSSRGRCPAPAHISGTLIEPYVTDVAFRLARGQRPVQTSPAALARLRHDADVAEAALAAYRDNSRLAARLGPDRFAEGSATRMAAVDRAWLAVEAAQARERAHDATNLQHLERRWPDLTRQQRRDTIAQLIDCAFVSRGRMQAPERTYICRRGEAPLDLPRKGWRGARCPPFDPADCVVTRAPPTITINTKAESRTRIHGALSAFCAGREALPEAQEFIDAGHLALHRQMMLTGGPGIWAARLGLRYEKRLTIRHWSEDTIRETLRDFLKGRTTWPTQREFREAGLSHVHEAISRHGGARHWASAMDFAQPGRPMRWTHPALETELRTFIGTARHYPRRREFLRAGRDDLYQAVLHHGGPDFWARRLKVARKTPGVGVPSVLASGERCHIR
jgi:site-specific DNA recombinase